MKIGILTYHRAENYGALLQAYALRTYLQSLGHDVSFVDYWPEYHSDYFCIFSWKRLSRLRIDKWIIHLLTMLIWAGCRYVRKHRLQRFMHERLGLSPSPEYVHTGCVTGHFDVVVYGSDQIWRKQNLGGVGFDDWYFGVPNVEADKKIVYAGSMGVIKNDEADNDYIQKMMRNFDRISVRESDLQDYLQGLKIHSQLVIDPVFLLSKKQWQKIMDPQRVTSSYILFYNLLNTPESTQFAESLSRNTGLPIREVNKNLSFRHLGERYISTASVGKFLRLIHDAELVVSNSFHGVAFSIIFEKQFYAVGMRERANRVVSLLESAGIPERYVENNNKTYTKDAISFDAVNQRIESVKEVSKNYLNESLQ